MGNKNLEARHDLRERDAAIFLPILYCFLVVHEDHKGVDIALVDDLGLGGISARHDI